MRAHVLPVLALSLAPASAHAGWTQPAGATYLKLWDQVLIGSRVFTTDGQQADLGARYQDHALKLYLEHGLDDGLTAVVRATPLGIASFGDDTRAYAGLVMVGLRVALARGELPLALELGYGYAPPLGDRAIATGVVDGQSYRYQPTLEQHVGQAELQLGWSWEWLWIKAHGGAIFSSGSDLEPAFEGGLRAGMRTTFGLTADAGVVLHMAIREPQLIDVTGVGNTRYLGLNLGAGYAITEGFGIRVDLGLAPYAVSNAATPSLGVGVELRR
jgi:hypothetical protein